MNPLAEVLLAERDLDIAAGLIPASAPRGLSHAERRSAVNFARIDQATTALATDTARVLVDARDRWLTGFAGELRALARRAGAHEVEVRLAWLGTLGPQLTPRTTPIINGTARRIGPLLRTAATRGVEHLVEEAARQGVTVPVGPLTDEIRAHADAMAGVVSEGAIRRAATSISTLTIPDGATLEEMFAAIDRALRLVPTRGIETDLARVPVEQSYGRGRMSAVAEAPPPAEIYASELRDAAECWACEAIDNTSYASLDDARADYNPTYRFCLGGERCRGSLVFIFAGEDALLNG